MRQLTEEETRNLFAKLALFLGENLKYLIDREDEDHVFRLQDQKIYYMSKSVLDIAQLVGRDELVSAGVYVGNYTKAGKVKLYITALPLLAKYAKYKVWVKPGGEQVYLYGNNVLKTHVAKMTENVPQYQGVVVFSMNDVPLGFGVAARSTEQSLKIQPHDVVVFNQADLGEYLRTVEDKSEFN
jgi:60S ribosome subunit biogenesis protein NIP7